MSYHLSNLAEESLSLKTEERYCHLRSRPAAVSFGAISCLSAGVLMLSVWATSLLISPDDVRVHSTQSEVATWNQLPDAEIATTESFMSQKAAQAMAQRAAMRRRTSRSQSRVRWQSPPRTFATRVQTAVRPSSSKPLDL